ncbi:hypothetical protein A2U01_0070672, partial [Trifolium medium]|nr:hypothetical protein [Trifolium medium]
MGHRGEDVRRKEVGRTREEEGEGDGVRIGEVMVFTGMGTRKKGEGVNRGDETVAKTHYALQETKGKKDVGGSACTIPTDSGTKLIRKYRSNVD